MLHCSFGPGSASVLRLSHSASPPHQTLFVTLHAKRGLKDFTENREIFSRSRCVNFNFHGVKRRNHSNTKNFHSWRETNHAVNDR